VVDAAAWAAIAAGMAHSIFDWNMHAPANALVACVIVGLALSSVVPRGPDDNGRSWAWPGRLFTAAFVAAVLASVGLLARDAALERPVRQLQQAITAARLAKSQEAHAAAADRLASAIAEGESALGFARGHWRLPMLLGQAALHRTHAAGEGGSEEQSPAGPATAASREAAERWFQAAGIASPARRGLPEKVPPKPEQPRK
jgi:hypothetical protein